jgi:hypothetical protein
MPERVLIVEIAPHDEVRHVPELRYIDLGEIGSAGRLHCDQRLDLVGRIERGSEAEIAALAVHDNDARTDFLHERVVGGLRRPIVGDPAPWDRLRLSAWSGPRP